MNLPTVVILLILAAAIALALRSVIRSRRSGGCAGCPGGCACAKDARHGGCCH